MSHPSRRWESLTIEGGRVGQLAFSYHPPQAGGTFAPGYPGVQWLDHYMQSLWQTRSCGGEVSRTQSCRSTEGMQSTLHCVHHRRFAFSGTDRWSPASPSRHSICSGRGVGFGLRGQQHLHPQPCCHLTSFRQNSTRAPAFQSGGSNILHPWDLTFSDFCSNILLNFSRSGLMYPRKEVVKNDHHQPARRLRTGLR